MANAFTPTMFPLVEVRKERDPDTGQMKMLGYVTGAWRRYQEGVSVAVTPGATGEMLSSTGSALVWQKVVDANVAAAAAIAWTKISKAGSSLADLATRSAGDLTSGTLSAARLPTLSSSFLYANTAATVGAGATTFLGLPSESATEAQVNIVVPFAGVLRNLYVQASAAAGVGQSFTYTVRKNGADTGLTIGVSGAAQTNNHDTSNTVTVAAGDLITVKLVTSAGAAVTRHQVALEIATA